MSRKFKVIILAVCILLQLTVLSHFTPMSLVPNYTFLFTVAICIISEKAEDVVIAGGAGLAVDMFTGAPIGLNTLLYMYISIGVILISEKIYIKRLRVVLPVCFAASFIHELLFGIFSTLLRRSVFHLSAVVSVVFPAAVINSIIFIPVYVVLSHIRFEKKIRGIKYERQI